MEFKEVIQKRYSCKKYSDRQVEKEKLEAVLVVAFDKTNVFIYPGGSRDSGVEDATIAATHMILTV